MPDGSLHAGLVQDCEALLGIASELLRADVQVNWGADEMVDDWDGIIVSGDPPRVTGLSFNREFGFAGSLPPSLAKLTALEILSIEGGSITGSIPPHLASLRSLKNLTLTFVNMSGPIPAELGILTNLEILVSPSQ